MRFAIALAALLLAGPARAADFLATSDLRSYCMSQNVTSQLVCKYYLQGIVDVTIMAVHPNSLAGRIADTAPLPHDVPRHRIDGAYA